MEKIQKRNEYLENFKEFCDKLNKKSMKKLREHEYEYFRNHIKNIEGLTNEEKKVFILLELTRERKSCAAIIKLLRESNQEKAAKELEGYNTSPGLINICELSTKTKILVNAANIPKEGSLCYPLNRKPRGKCLIINNVGDVYKETQRFKHVFNELYFDVKTAYNLNVQRIEDKLKALSKDESLIEDEALFVMITSHGCDEKIFGIKACLQSDPNDLMKISDIVDIFSPENCEQLNKKSKIFIFDCCGIKDPIHFPSVDITSSTSGKQRRTELSKDLKTEYQTDNKNEKLSLKFNFASTEWVNENSNTFIIYSCSEGHESHKLEKSLLEDDITAFGQVFSHAIARYACEENLQNTMARVYETIKLKKQTIEATQFKPFQELLPHYFELTPKWFNDMIDNVMINFTEISKLGEGKFGTVFKAVKSNKIYATKKISEQRTGFHYFGRELIAAFDSILKLENEFLVKYYYAWAEKDFKITNGLEEWTENYTFFITMELCDKELIEIHEEIKKDSKLYSKNLFSLLGFYLLSQKFIEILMGVKYLHNKNIVHRDLKPDNILLKNGIIKIADFGLAKVHDMNKDPNIRYTRNFRSIKYAAPEVLDNEYYDTKADIYSLGVILQELFAIDFNEANKYISDEVLNRKYENIEKLIERMMNINHRKRPNCGRILDERENWATNDNDINIEEELNFLLEIGVKTYVQSIICSKLSNINILEMFVLSF